MSSIILSESGIKVGRAPAEMTLAWPEVYHVTAYADELPIPPFVTRYLSFGHECGHDLEINDADEGWQQALELLPRFLPCSTAVIANLQPEQPPVTLFSRARK